MLCYFDPFSGISGDMTVAALLDAGADWPTVEAALQSLQLNATVAFSKTKRQGMAAGKFTVSFAEQKNHRHLPEIEAIVQGGALSEKARQNALAVFRALGEAEAKAHDLPLEKVHFHEVGAVDSICDIVAACVALDSLKVDEIYAAPVNVGGGTVQTEHGVLPVPAPATAQLLKGFSVYSAGPAMELTTPTGAAILAALAQQTASLPAMRLHAQGFGAGDKDFPGRANVLRVLIGERTGALESTAVTLLEANIDDSTPQVLGYAMEKLLEAGALDVTLTPVYMKKNRPGVMLSVVSTPAMSEQLAAVVFAETSTLGLRMVQAERRVLARQIAQIETPYGAVRIKYNHQGSFAPEYEDCRKAAAAHRVPLRQVIGEAARLFAEQKSSYLNE